ncbi:unnamed protein product, partial [Chrysoparadoxa australica]
GSVHVIATYLTTALLPTSILYQRGIYPPELFARQSKYGLAMMVSKDDGLNAYLGNVIKQLGEWLLRGEVQRLVVVVTGSESGETLERWVFNVQAEGAAAKPLGEADTNTASEPPKKSIKEIHNEIQAIIRQITASVTFLPLLNEPCAFDLLVYTDTGAMVPTTWESSDPKYIQDSSEVRLRSFTTKVHKVDAMVAYRVNDDDI